MSNNTTKVTFGNDQVSTFDSSMSEYERFTAFYSPEEQQTMKATAYRMTLMFTEHGTPIAASESTRGLEKIMGDRKKSFKRKQNVIRSTIQLLDMAEGSSTDTSIKDTLETYTKKHQKLATERALKLATTDALIAQQIYNEQVPHSKSVPVSKFIGYTAARPTYRRQSLAATTA